MSALACKMRDSLVPRPPKERSFFGRPGDEAKCASDAAVSEQNPGMWAVVRQPQARRKVTCYDRTAHYNRFMVAAGAVALSWK